MDREYDVFELLPDGAPIWRGHVQGLQNAQRELSEVSTNTLNECFVIHLPTKEIVARTNAIAEGIERDRLERLIRGEGWDRSKGTGENDR